jgi:tetratricopeptide (TPR) repeat protein
MDSEHRHELKTNELADLLTHLPQFFKKHASTIIGIALIVLAIVTWPVFSKMSREKTITEESRVAESIRMLSGDIQAALQAYKNNPEELAPALSTIQANAEALMEMTSETDNPNLEALAYIKAAQALRTELHLRNAVVDAQTVETQTEKAQEAYEKAAETAAIPTVKAMARFGVALCTEERGQIEQAADLYKAIVADETYAATVFPTLAQQRLDGLDDSTETFTFVAAPAVEVQPAPLPEFELTPEMLQQQAPVIEMPAATQDAAPQTPESADSNSPDSEE